MGKDRREHHSSGVAYTSGGGVWKELILPLDFESVDQNLGRFFAAQMRVGISASRERTETGTVKYFVNVPGCDEVQLPSRRPPCYTVELVKLGANTRLIGTAAGRNVEAMKAMIRSVDVYLFPEIETTPREQVAGLVPGQQHGEAAPQDDPAHLKRVLDDSFSESDLRDLCFELRVDFDSLLGSAKNDKSRELVLYLLRRGRISELGEALHRLRPNLFARNNP